MNVYTYTVAIKAPNDFAAAAFIGQLHESADQWRRLKTPIHIVSIDAETTDIEIKPPIDTIPLF